jgi:hypothetical protein
MRRLFWSGGQRGFCSRVASVKILDRSGLTDDTLSSLPGAARG